MPATVTCAFNSSTQEGEAGRPLCIQGPCPPHSECQAQQGYIGRLSKQANKQTLKQYGIRGWLNGPRTCCPSKGSRVLIPRTHANASKAWLASRTSHRSLLWVWLRGLPPWGGWSEPEWFLTTNHLVLHTHIHKCIHKQMQTCMHTHMHITHSQK